MFELDEEETEALFKMLREPNPGAKKLRERAKKQFEGLDLTADEIPIRRLKDEPR